MTEAFTVMAPAKLNLTLEVLGIRPDGFHEIRSVVQTVSLCDRISFHLSETTRFISNSPGWRPEASLVPRAVTLLKQATSCTKGVTIEVQKNIPFRSGLGGDSSDAAAILSGLNKLWELRLSQEILLELAARLGSDVPLFLHNGTLLISGRGEVVRVLPPLPRYWFVILMPPLATVPGKTAQLYARLKPIHYSTGAQTEKLVHSLKVARSKFSSLFYNAFEQVAFDYFTGLEAYCQRFLTPGAKEVHLAGSGPAMFTLSDSEDEAEKIYQNLKKQNLECYLAEPMALDCNL